MRPQPPQPPAQPSPAPGPVDDADPARAAWPRRVRGGGMAVTEVDVSGPGHGRRRAGRGFAYVDCEGDRIADPEEIARIKALAIPPAWRDVWICADPQGHVRATGVDDAGRRQYLYHPEWRAERDRAKHDRMAELAAYARERIRLPLATPADRRLSGAMTAFRLPDGLDVLKLRKALWGHRIEVPVIERPDRLLPILAAMAVGGAVGAVAARRVVMTARLMLAHGRIQRSREGIVHLVAERLADRTADLRHLGDRPPKLPLSHADEVNRPCPGSAAQPPRCHPRDVRVIPKSRDFR